MYVHVNCWPNKMLPSDCYLIETSIRTCSTNSEIKFHHKNKYNVLLHLSRMVSLRQIHIMLFLLTTT